MQPTKKSPIPTNQLHKMNTTQNIHRVALTTIIAIAVCVCPAPRARAASFVGGDDFSSVSGSWGPDNIFGAGSFSVSGGLLNYTTSGAPTATDGAERYWTLNTGSYTAAWSVQADLTVGNFASSQNIFAEFNIENASDSSDVARLGFWGGTTTRRYYADILTNGIQTEPSAQPLTSSTNVALQLSFDPLSKIITFVYDNNAGVGGYSFTPFFSKAINSAAENWNMTTSSAFRVKIGIIAYNNQPVTTGQVNFDNFQAPEPSTITLTAMGLPLLLSRRRLR